MYSYVKKKVNNNNNNQTKPNQTKKTKTGPGCDVLIWKRGWNGQ